MNTVPAVTRRQRWKRVLRWLGGVVLLLALLAGGIAWWAASDGSLLRGLQLARRWLPAGQHLEFSGVQGSIMGGGHVGHLQWSSPGTTLTADELRMEWSLLGLLRRDLHVRALTIQRLRLRTTPQPQQSGTSSPMPTSATLPVHLTVPLQISRLEIESVAADGTTGSTVLEDISARYRYDGAQHALWLDSLRYGSSQLQAEAHLQAATLDFAAQVHARLRDLVPDESFAMRADVTLGGTLAGGDDAALQADLDARQQDAAPAEAARLQAQATIHPWRRQPVQQLVLQLTHINAHALLAAAPATALDGRASVQPVAGEAAGWTANVELTNSLPGAWDRGRLPLDHLQARLRLAAALWRIDTLELRTGAGRAQLLGDYAPQSRELHLRAQLQQVPLQRLERTVAPATLLSGHAAISGIVGQRLDFDSKLAGTAVGRSARQRDAWDIRAFEARGSWTPTRLTIARIHADVLQTVADGRDIEVSLPRLNDIRANLKATAPGITLAADVAMRDASGGGRVSLQLRSAQQLESWLRNLPFVGASVPQLHARGAAGIDLDWQGGWRQWAAGISEPASHPHLDLNARAHAEGFGIELPAATAGAATRVEFARLALDLHGSPATARIDLDAAGRINSLQARLNVRMRSTAERDSAGTSRWRIALENCAASASFADRPGPWQLQLSKDVEFVVQTGGTAEVRASAGSFTLTAPAGVGASAPLEVAWQPVLWRRDPRGTTTLRSTGTVSGLQPAWLDALLAGNGAGVLAAAGIQTDLVLGGGWDAQLADHVQVSAHLQRQRGDLTLAGADSPAGIRDVRVAVEVADQSATAQLHWDSERAGTLTARVATQLTHQGNGWSLQPGAPLSGSIQAKLQDVRALTLLVPPGWRIQGALDADLRVAGTLRQPQLDGDIQGSGLNVRSVLDGVELHDGTLRASLHDSRIEISELTFQGGTGSKAYVRGRSGNLTPPPVQRGRMSAQGSIDWSEVGAADAAGSGIRLDLQAELQHMQVLVRNDRQMTLSGKLQAHLQQGALRVRGNLSVDRASIVLPEAAPPQLGDDVVVERSADLRNPAAAGKRQARGELDTPRPMDLDISLDLGHDLALQGQGITTRLEGAINVRSAAVGSPGFAVYGEVRTVEGRYRAWGQELNVETGVVRFNGSYTNPTLDLVAIRPNIAVRAGVRVTGTLLAPRVQLFSDPDMPQSEQLSWVVLGRATVMTGAEGTSLQQAALQLSVGQLSGKLASGLGLDELGLSDSGVTIGKRISNELYLTYQQGLAGAASTLFIFYDITRRLTLRAQAGAAGAMDLVYTIRFD